MTSAKPNHRHFVNLFLSYAIVFVVPLALLLVLLLFFKGQLLKGESDRLLSDVMKRTEHMQYSLDGYYERAQAISLSIAQSDDLLSILRSSDAIKSIGDARVFRLVSQLRSMMISNDFIDEIIIHITHSDTYIDQNGYLTDDRLPLEIFSDDERSPLLDSFTVGTALCQESGSLVFLRSYPVSAMGEKNRCMIMISLKARILRDIVKDSAEGYSYAIFNDSSGEDILHSFRKSDARPGNPPSNVKRQAASNGALKVYRKSTRLPITYSSSLPEALILEKQHQLDAWAILAFLLCAMAGTALIFHFTKKSLDPLEQLFAAVKGEKINMFSLMDPYSEIKNMLLDAAAQKLAFTDLNKKQDELEGKRVFVEALTDRDTDPDFLAQCARKIGIELSGNCYCFIQLKCADMGDYFKDSAAPLRTVQQVSPLVLCEQILKNILAENFSVTSICYGCYVLYATTFKPTSAERWNGAIEDMVVKVQQFLRDTYSLETMVAVSNAHESVLNARETFDEVIKTMEYMELAGNRTFARYSRIVLGGAGKGIGSAQTKGETLLLGHIKAGDFVKAKTNFNEIMETCFFNASGSPQLLKFRLYALIGEILKAINGVDVPDMSELADKVNIATLMDCDNAKGFQAEVNRLFDELKRIYDEAERGSKDREKEEIISIVNANYMNCDLNVSMIADLMDMNLDRLSRTFTRMTGMGLLDYIHTIRIQKAKHLIEDNPDLTIQNISSMVGYANCESFIRAFKRMEGITPGRFKVSLS